jgi:hypothetical protein
MVEEERGDDESSWLTLESDRVASAIAGSGPIHESERDNVLVANRNVAARGAARCRRSGGDGIRIILPLAES